MTTNYSNKVAVKQTIEDLIQIAKSYDLEKLERIYHDDMSIIMYDISGELNTANKKTFMDIFKHKRDSGEAAMNTWADFHHIEATENTGHVLLSRKNDLAGHPQILLLSIDLIFESGRWQVIREVIFLRPDANS